LRLSVRLDRDQLNEAITDWLRKHQYIPPDFEADIEFVDDVDYIELINVAAEVTVRDPKALVNVLKEDQDADQD
jgi:hypothetical protein